MANGTQFAALCRNANSPLDFILFLTVEMTGGAGEESAAGGPVNFLGSGAELILDNSVVEFEWENDLGSQAQIDGAVTVTHVEVRDEENEVIFPKTEISPVTLPEGSIIRFTELKLTLT